jgi:predicted ATPase/class 3 adenylate cyclase/Tfp pilus assembly protein PilF
MRAAAAPTGPVTLVFTDVQGSTELWERAADTMRPALELHNALLRALIVELGGYEVKTEGDAFMVAFSSPLQAVRWCLRAQEALLAADWPAELLSQPEGGEQRAADGALLLRGLRVRMGAHTGEPDCRPDPTTGRMDYFGPMVNRAARVGNAGHGGQVLLSGRTFKAVEPHLADLDRPEALDLGEHRLKGLESAERLVQLLPWRIAARRFPPPKTLDPKKTNLTAHPTRFVGRAADLASLHALFTRGERLVTVLGPGGTGKTRFATRYGALHLEEFAREGGGGVWFCELTEARDAAGICSMVGAALGVPLTSASTDAAALLGHALAGHGRTLLVLDNFEQAVAHAPATVGRWMALAPQARFLVTSRERLRLDGEVRYELQPLGLPREGEPVESADAAQLFLERARAVRPDYTLSEPEAPVVAELVRALEGIPLAIELAAARMSILTPAQIRERIGRRLDLLAGSRGDATARQATLRGAIDWSWELLQPWEQAALAQASLFHEGFALEAAEAVVDLAPFPAAPWVIDVLQALRDKSLLRAYEPAGFPGELRFGMFESIRAYAAEQLERDPATSTAARARRAAYFLKVGADWAAGVDRHGGLAKLRRLALERENLLAIAERALAASPPTRETAEAALAAALALEPLLTTRGPAETHLRLLDRSLEAGTAAGAERELVARALEARARARASAGRLKDAFADRQAALEIAREAGERALEGSVVGGLAVLLQHQGRLGQALDHYHRGLAILRECGAHALEGQLLAQLGTLYKKMGRAEEARRSYERALALLLEVGHLRYQGIVHNNLGNLCQMEDRSEDAGGHYQKALEILRELGDRRIEGITLLNLGVHFFERGRIEEARAHYQGALAILAEVGDVHSAARTRGHLGQLHLHEGQPGEARAQYERALPVLHEVGDAPTEGLFLGFLAAAEAGLGQVAEARARFADARERLQRVGDPLLLDTLDLLAAHLDLALAREAAAAGDADAAARNREGAGRRLAAAEATGPSEETAPGAAGAAQSEEYRFALQLLQKSLKAAPIQ